MNKYRVIRGALYCCDIRTYRKTNYMYATIKKNEIQDYENFIHYAYYVYVCT